MYISYNAIMFDLYVLSIVDSLSNVHVKIKVYTFYAYIFVI